MEPPHRRQTAGDVGPYETRNSTMAKPVKSNRTKKKLKTRAAPRKAALKRRRVRSRTAKGK